jgi:hypothetical protein
MDLIATKSFRYAGRALQPGSSFRARNRDGRILVAIKKAMPFPERNARETELTKLRSEATALGLDVDMRWGARRLKAEIDKRQA